MGVTYDLSTIFELKRISDILTQLGLRDDFCFKPMALKTYELKSVNGTYDLSSTLLDYDGLEISGFVGGDSSIILPLPASGEVYKFVVGCKLYTGNTNTYSVQLKTGKGSGTTATLVIAKNTPTPAGPTWFVVIVDSKGNVSIPGNLDIGGSKLTKKIQRFTSTGTWTCPAGVYVVKDALLVGGGGGGATGGGGGGAVVRRPIPVVPGTTYTITIGAGGAAGAVGGTTSFGTLLYAYGGGVGGSNATVHGDHGTDAAAGAAGSADGGWRSSMQCEDRDKVFGGLNPSSAWAGSLTASPSELRMTAAAANKGTGAAPGTSKAGYSGYAEIEWEE